MFISQQKAFTVPQTMKLFSTLKVAFSVYNYITVSWCFLILLCLIIPIKFKSYPQSNLLTNILTQANLVPMGNEVYFCYQWNQILSVFAAFSLIHQSCITCLALFSVVFRNLGGSQDIVITRSKIFHPHHLDRVLHKWSSVNLSLITATLRISRMI